MEKDIILRGLDAHAIQQYQQNRFPCLFVDFIEEAVPGKSAKGYKNFTFNEWYFPAHFEDEPVVPGFIQIEALTQVFLMTFLTFPEAKGKKTGFVSVKNANFKKKIIPGMRLDMIANLESYRRGLAKGNVTGKVCGEIACTIELVVTVPEIMIGFTPNLRKE
ncbi:MAG: 3-hydroxyacyl-ACP dehydratase FabZ family protein [Pseudomonadota bacterium]|nr:3-hydroxyacyl-ACP dehydratase FabZ family protein [Pseudomonadota bacterium]